MSGKFFFIGIDIGNPYDISLRAIEVLKNSKYLYCEHTVKGKELSSRFNLSASIHLLAAEEEEGKIPQIVKKIEEGSIVSYISDAGLPILQDPGSKLLKYLRALELPCEIIPGASAISLAFAYSQHPKPWVVHGFWDGKVEIDNSYTNFYYLSCHDYAKFYQWAKKNAHKVEIFKDLTREKYQQVGNLEDFSPEPTSKGEFMVSVKRNDVEEDSNLLIKKYDTCLPESISNRDRISILKNLTHLPKKLIYEWVHENYRS